MAIATPALDADPRAKRSTEAMHKLGKFCMDHLPDDARSEFIRLWSAASNAWLDEIEDDVRVMERKNQLIQHYKSQIPFPFSPTQRN